jgi:hypothetical protein
MVTPSEMTKLLNDQAADGTGTELVVLAGAVLAATVEALVRVFLTGPVPVALEFILEVGDQQVLLTAGGQATMDRFSPVPGLLPGERALIARQEDDVLVGLAVVAEQDACVILAISELRACDGSDVDRGLGGCHDYP